MKNDRNWTINWKNKNYSIFFFSFAKFFYYYAAEDSKLRTLIGHFKKNYRTFSKKKQDLIRPIWRLATTSVFSHALENHKYLKNYRISIYLEKLCSIPPTNNKAKIKKKNIFFFLSYCLELSIVRQAVISNPPNPILMILILDDMCPCQEGFAIKIFKGLVARSSKKTIKK